MVAVPSESPNEHLKSQLAIRNSYTAMQAKPQLPLWRPRDGRNEAHLKWLDALTNFEHDVGIDIDAPCPTLSEVVELIPHYTSRGLINDDDSELFALFQAAREEWISLNELLFDVIRASLILEGASLERDLRMLGTLMSSAKDGRSIRKWAMQFADMNTVASQADLQSKLEVKLPAQACLTELESHSTKLWSSWLLISGNDPNDLAKLASFHYRWLNSLPSEPIGSHLSSVRKWLADKISENSTILCDVDSAIDIMIRYAASIGLTDSNPRHQDATLAGFRPTINAMFNALKNDCNFCKANACQSNQHPKGVTACLSRHDSKVPISQIKGGDLSKAMVLGLREYHEEHKDAQSLKGINVDLQACLAKVRTQRDASGAGADKQVTLIDFGNIKAIDSSEITDMSAFQRWLNGKTGGVDCAAVIATIGPKNDVSLASASRGKTPHLTEWQRRLAASRASPLASYSPFTVHVTGTDQPSASKGSTFTSLVRVLDQSITADKPKPFSLRNLVKSFVHFIGRLADYALHMEARNVVCVLAALHAVGVCLRPHQRRVIDKLKLLSRALVLRIVSAISSRLQGSATALAVHRSILAA